MASKVLTMTEGYQMCRISRSTWFAMARRGELPIIRIGKRMLIREDDVQRFLDQRRQEPINFQPHDSSVA
jgi:excisionase family DNA binding protein